MTNNQTTLPLNKKRKRMRRTKLLLKKIVLSIS